MNKRVKKTIYKMYKGTRMGLAPERTYTTPIGVVNQRTRRTGDETWVRYGFLAPSDIVYDVEFEYIDGESDEDMLKRFEVEERRAYEDLTDEEINQFFNDEMWVRIYSDYDCTGRSFTRFIHWHRNPCGLISYQHHMGIDI